MMKNRLLATSIVALGMFYSAEGMKDVLHNAQVSKQPATCGYIDTNNADSVTNNADSVRDKKQYIGFKKVILGDKRFKECTSLKEIIIPDGDTELGDECFLGCTSLTKIVLPSTLKLIGAQCFMECDKLENIIFLGDNATIPSNWMPYGALVKYTRKVNNDGMILHKYGVNGTCEPLGVLPKITANGCRNFCGWMSKTAINIEEAIKGNELFFWRALVECSTNFAKDFNANFLKYLHINVPNGITRLNDRCFGNYAILQSIKLPSTLEEIGSRCFDVCPYLTTLEIPTTVTKIGSGIFDYVSANSSLNDIFEQKAKEKYEAYKYSMKDVGDIYTFEQYKKTINVDLLNIIYDRSTGNPSDMYIRKAEDVFKCLQNLKLKSFGWLDFVEPQDMAEFSGKYPELTARILIDGYGWQSNGLIGLEIPTTVTSLNSRILFLENVSSLTFPSTIKTVYENSRKSYMIFEDCFKLKELHIPLDMPGLSSKCSFLRCSNLTAIYDVDNPNSDPVTFVSSRNPSQLVEQEVVKLKKLKLSEQK